MVAVMSPTLARWAPAATMTMRRNDDNDVMMMMMMKMTGSCSQRLKAEDKLVNDGSGLSCVIFKEHEH